MPALAGVTTSVEDIPFVDSGGERPVQLRLVGDDLAALQQAGQATTIGIRNQTFHQIHHRILTLPAAECSYYRIE